MTENKKTWIPIQPCRRMAVWPYASSFFHSRNKYLSTYPRQARPPHSTWLLLFNPRIGSVGGFQLFPPPKTPFIMSPSSPFLSRICTRLTGFLVCRYHVTTWNWYNSKEKQKKASYPMSVFGKYRLFSLFIFVKVPTTTLRAQSSPPLQTSKNFLWQTTGWNSCSDSLIPVQSPGEHNKKCLN